MAAKIEEWARSIVLNLIEQYKGGSDTFDSSLRIECNKCPTDHLLAMANAKLPDSQRVHVTFSSLSGPKLKVFIRGKIDRGPNSYVLFGEIAEAIVWQGIPIQEGTALFGFCTPRLNCATLFVVHE